MKNLTATVLEKNNFDDQAEHSDSNTTKGAQKSGRKLFEKNMTGVLLILYLKIRFLEHLSSPEN